MNVKEELIDILGEFTLWPSKMKNVWIPQAIEKLADHLISNGVTVQEWISVKDRLPEPKHEFDERNWYLVALSNGVVKELAYEFNNNSVFGYGWRETAYPVTHWMPLPEPPKGE